MTCTHATIITTNTRGDYIIVSYKKKKNNISVAMQRVMLISFKMRTVLTIYPCLHTMHVHRSRCVNTLYSRITNSVRHRLGAY